MLRLLFSQEECSIACEIHYSESKLVVLEHGASHVVCLHELTTETMGRCVVRNFEIKKKKNFSCPDMILLTTYLF